MAQNILRSIFRLSNKKAMDIICSPGLGYVILMVPVALVLLKLR